jgi:hypothetical protein
MSKNDKPAVRRSEIALADDAGAPSLATVQEQMLADISAIYPAGSVSKWFAERRAVHDLRKLPHAKRQIDLDAAIESYRYNANRALMIQQAHDQEVVRRGMARFDMELADEAYQRHVEVNHRQAMDSMRETHVLSEAAADNVWSRQKEGFELSETQHNKQFGRDVTLLRETHHLNEEAKRSAWEHRKEEHLVVGDLELRRMVVEAVANAMKQSSAQERIEATRMVNEEISRIRRDPDLTDDEKHLHIRSLVDTLPTLLKAGRLHDV